MVRNISTNIVSGNIGEHASVIQISSTGRPIETEHFVPNHSAKYLSPEWLLFYQDNVPLVGRRDEIESLQLFIEDSRPFAWWTFVGDGGVGKSRLAYVLLKELPRNWHGGFVAPDSLTTQTASDCELDCPTLWILDYATAAGDKLGSILAILARRFRSSKNKIRLLLLERTADEKFGWYFDLFEQTGRNAPSLRASLFAPPRLLQPLAGKAAELLRHFLVGANKSMTEADELSRQFNPRALAKATNDGNPLLVAMIASHLVSGLESRRAITSDELIDSYLRRELRLWRSNCNTDEQFAAACHILLITTLGYPIPYIRESDEFIMETIEDSSPTDTNSNRPKNTKEVVTAAEMAALGINEITQTNAQVLEHISQASNYSDVEECLRVLQEQGVSALTHWALKPDLLGERFIELMVTKPTPEANRRMYLPSYDPPRLGRSTALSWLFDSGHFVTFLARLKTQSIMAILSIAPRYDSRISLRLALIIMRQIAELRGSALPRSFLSLLNKENFPGRFDPSVLTLVEKIFDLPSAISEKKSTARYFRELEAITGSPFSIQSLWIIPFAATMDNIHGERLLSLFVFFSKRLPPTTIYTRAREIIIVSRFLKRCTDDVIDRIKDNPRRAGARQDFVDAGLATLIHIGEAANLLLSRTTKENNETQPHNDAENHSEDRNIAIEDALELTRAIAWGCVNFSFILIHYAHTGDEKRIEEFSRRAAGAAYVGINCLSKTPPDKEGHDAFFYLMRNYLGGCQAAKIDLLNVQNLRSEWLDRCKNGDDVSRFLDIAIDGLRIALNQGDLDLLRRMAKTIDTNRAWIGVSMKRIYDEKTEFGRAMTRFIDLKKLSLVLGIARVFGRLFLDWHPDVVSDFIRDAVTVVTRDFSQLSRLSLCLEKLAAHHSKRTTIFLDGIALLVDMCQENNLDWKMRSFDYRILSINFRTLKKWLIEQSSYVRLPDKYGLTIVLLVGRPRSLVKDLERCLVIMKLPKNSTQGAQSLSGAEDTIRSVVVKKMKTDIERTFKELKAPRP